MANVKLLNFSASEINFINNIQKTNTFELTNRCSYQLGFSANKKLCRGEMTVEMSNKNEPDAFNVKVKLVGNFVVEGDDPQDEVHKASYKLLFPHAKALITSITVAANVPPLFFPDINIDNQSVYMIENPKK